MKNPDRQFPYVHPSKYCRELSHCDDRGRYRARLKRAGYTRLNCCSNLRCHRHLLTDLDPMDVFAVRVVNVNRARETRVKGMDRADDLQGLTVLRDRGTDQ